MSTGRTVFAASFLCGTSLFFTGCLSKKNDDVAVEGAAPPPAAYPESTTPGYADTAPGAPAAPAAPSTPPPAPAPQPFQLREGEQLVTHMVESGENLSVIATKYNTSISRIQAANGMTNTTIYAGKPLQVPTSAPPSLASTTPSIGAPSINPVTSPVPAAPSSPNPYGPTSPRYGVTAPAPAPAPAPAAPAPSSASIAPPPVSGGYPSTTAPPTAPPIQIPSTNPASTSYQRVSPPPASGESAFPTPDLSGAVR